ncbi:MAG TPA: flavin reductase family protein [Methanomassiliicoccales archaeon]|jgi:flavin reductase (DIM6/NTAB) family NADH-FMN oxidoreductase RutF
MEKVQIGSHAPPMAMPVCLVGSNIDGKANFCTVAWFTILDDEPPMVAMVLGKGRLTMEGIRQNGCFSLNIPSEFNVTAVDYCGINSGHDTDKSKVFGVSYGTLRTAPLANECRISAECKLAKVIEFPGTDLVIGEVVQLHVDKTLVKNGKVDVEDLRQLLYAFPGGPYLSIGPAVAEAFKVGKTFTAKK